MFGITNDPKNYEVNIKIKNITHDIQTGIRKAFFYLGKDLKSYTSRKMQEQKSGRTYNVSRNLNSHKSKTGAIYTVYGKGRKFTYVASAPGEIPYSKSPATTSRLRKSLNFLVNGWESLEYGAETPYAKALEEGTDKMAPRPYLKKTVEENYRNAQVHFETEINKQLLKING